MYRERSWSFRGSRLIRCLVDLLWVSIDRSHLSLRRSIECLDLICLTSQENQTLFASSKYASVIHPRNVSSSFSPHRHFDVILHIINVTKSDHGIYQCQAENSLGVDITEIVLTGLSEWLAGNRLWEKNLSDSLAVPDPPSQLRPINTSHSSISISWATNFDGGAAQTYQLRYRLSTDDQYSYEPVPGDAQSFDLENLRAGQEYHLSMRSNNTHYLSEWTDELIVWTTAELSFSPLYSFILSPKRFSWVATLVLTVVGLLVVLINIVLISIFVIKRRRARITNDNSSTTGTNETETNTVDLFQPMAPNLLFEGPSSTTMNTYPFDNYQKYDDDDIKRPFVSSYSSTNLNRFTPNYQPQYQGNSDLSGCSLLIYRWFREHLIQRHSKLRDDQSKINATLGRWRLTVCCTFSESIVRPMIIFDCTIIPSPVSIDLWWPIVVSKMIQATRGSMLVAFKLSWSDGLRTVRRQGTIKIVVLFLFSWINVWHRWFCSTARLIASTFVSAATSRESRRRLSLLLP